jgi:hypothetical protein
MEMDAGLSVTVTITFIIIININMITNIPIIITATMAHRFV